MSLLAVLLVLNGCAAVLVGAAGGAAGTVYVMGKLEKEIRAPVTVVRQATLAGLQDLDMPIVKDTGDEHGARVTSELTDETPVWINIESMSPHWSRLTIRVGWLGNAARSRSLLRTIQEHLG